jgi:hypothetical protein
MAACLSGDGVAVATQTLGEICSAEVTGNPHKAMSSWRTWWSLINGGACPSSK